MPMCIRFRGNRPTLTLIPGSTNLEAISVFFFLFTLWLILVISELAS